jgi:uncharacterized protein GlcG (DUF336 family)
MRLQEKFNFRNIPSVATLATVIFILIGCGGGSSSGSSNPAPPPATTGPLTATDVQNIVQAAAVSADVDTMVIPVVDRGGNILAIFCKPSAPATGIGNFGTAVDVNGLAVALARTAAYFSNDQARLSSRTVRLISGIHFPPGVANAPNADLYGIENTNRGCTLATNYLPGHALQPSLSISGDTGLGIITGKSQADDSDPNAVNPGGVPIFRKGVVVGGVGVAGVGGDVAEYAAYTAATSNGFGPMPAAPGVIFMGGIAVPFVNQTSAPAGISPGTASGSYYLSYSPMASSGQPPEGDLIALAAGPLGGLSTSDVTQILNNAQPTANITRAAIRPSHRLNDTHGYRGVRSRWHFDWTTPDA